MMERHLQAPIYLPNPNEKAIVLLQALKSNPKRLLGNFNRIAGT